MKTLLRFSAVLGLVLAAVFSWGGQAVAQNVTDAEAYANVVPCLDASCTEVDPAGMEGVVITSYDAAKVEIDSCAVEVFPASGLHGCVITKHDGTGSYGVSNLAPGYTLISEEPEVAESMSEGTQLRWFALASGDVAPPADPVERMPEVGIGVVAENTGLLSAVAIGIAMIGFSATALRRYGKER